MRRALATIDRIQPARSAALSVRRLALRDFRNYRRLRLEEIRLALAVFSDDRETRIGKLEIQPLEIAKVASRQPRQPDMPCAHFP